MSMPKMKVTYPDGRELVVQATPRAQVMAEAHFSGLSGRVMLRASYYLAWATLHKSGQEPDNYEAFLDKIVGVEEYRTSIPVDELRETIDQFDREQLTEDGLAVIREIESILPGEPDPKDGKEASPATS